MTDSVAKCELCGEPMPEGEEMFKFHGYSGNCPKPPLPHAPSSSDALKSDIRALFEAMDNGQYDAIESLRAKIEREIA